MKYLPLREIDDVTNALNFDTADCRVVGACDIYTTKAAGSDKKLYKNIETSLETQYESLLRFSASLSPPEASTAAASLNLSRSSPFGPLSQISSRRTFAYLIATMNASNPDYDFSNFLRPTDFRREKSLRLVMNTLDTTLYNLRPRPVNSYLATPTTWSSAITTSGPSAAGPGQSWSPKMWRAIDKEMTLKECSIYCYSPDEDPYDDEEGQIWSLNYFFFNKQRKRVCYISLRGLSIFSSGGQIPKTPIQTTQYTDSDWMQQDEIGANKRANYWLGDRAGGNVQSVWGEDDDDDIASLQEDEPRLLPAEVHEARRMHSMEAGSPESDVSGSVASQTQSRSQSRSQSQSHSLRHSQRQLRSRKKRSRSRSMVRGVSEEIAEQMDI